MMDGENTEVVEDAEPVSIEGSAPEGQPSADDAMGAIWDKHQVNGVERGEGGKFKSGQQAEADGEQPAADDQDQEQPAQQEQTSEAPAHLPQSIKAKWNSIPADAREDIAKYVQERDRTVSQIGRSYQGVKSFGDALLAGQRAIPQLRDIPPEKIAQEAIELAVIQQQIQKDPASTLLQIAQRYGAVDSIRAILGGQAPSSEQHTISRMASEIDGLKRQLAEAGDPERINQTVSAAFERREFSNRVNDLVSGKEHYALVEPVLPDFINMAWQHLGSNADTKEVFELAYDMACNAMPSVRDKVRATVQAAPAIDPKRSETARRAASINVTSASNGKERPVSEMESLASAYDRAMAK